MTTTSQSITLIMDIAEVPGVGGKLAPEFRKLGIRCVADLLLHMPVRYEHEHEEQTIAGAGETVSPHHGADANIAVRGEIVYVAGQGKPAGSDNGWIVRAYEAR